MEERCPGSKKKPARVFLVGYRRVADFGEPCVGEEVLTGISPLGECCSCHHLYTINKGQILQTHRIHGCRVLDSGATIISPTCPRKGKREPLRTEILLELPERFLVPVRFTDNGKGGRFLFTFLKVAKRQNVG